MHTFIHTIKQSVSLQKNQRGFTVFEFLIVLGLIMIMLSIALVSFSQVKQNSRDNERLALVDDLSLSLHDYYLQCGSYPMVVDPSDPRHVDNPCPLLGETQTFIGPLFLENAAFQTSANTFTLPAYRDTVFFYVPLRSATMIQADVCDVYHIGAVLETKHRILRTDADVNTRTSDPVVGGVETHICNNANGIDGVDNDGDDTYTYDSTS